MILPVILRQIKFPGEGKQFWTEFSTLWVKIMGISRSNFATSWTQRSGMTKFVLALAMLALSTPADSFSTPCIGPSRDGTRLYSCATPLLPSAFGPLSVARAPSPWSPMETGKIQKFSRRKVQVSVSDGDRIDIRRSSIAPWTLPASGIFLEAALRGIFEAAHDSYSSAPDSMHKLQLLTRLLSQANEDSERSSEIFTSQRQGSLSVQNFKPQKKRK